MATRTGSKETPTITLTRDQLAELISRGSGIYSAFHKAALEGDNPVRINIVEITEAQAIAALDGLTLESNGASFGLDTQGQLVPGSSAWFGYVYGNADRIVGWGMNGEKKMLDVLEENQLREVLSTWIENGITPKAVK